MYELHTNCLYAAMPGRKAPLSCCDGFGTTSALYIAIDMWVLLLTCGYLPWESTLSVFTDVEYHYNGLKGLQYACVFILPLVPTGQTVYIINFPVYTMCRNSKCILHSLRLPSQLLLQPLSVHELWHLHSCKPAVGAYTYICLSQEVLGINYILYIKVTQFIPNSLWHTNPIASVQANG